MYIHFRFLCRTMHVVWGYVVMTELEQVLQWIYVHSVQTPVLCHACLVEAPRLACCVG